MWFADALNLMTMGSVSHVVKAMKYLVKDVHRLARLGVRLEDSPNGGFRAHRNSESSLVVEVKSKKHLDQPFIDLKESVLGKINESFSLWGRGWCLQVSRKVVQSKCRWLEKPDS